MFDRSLFKALMLIGIALPIASCTSSPSLTSIVVTPASMNFGGAGLTTQLTATGYYTHPNHPAKTEDITNQVSWASSTPACVTVSSTGLITSGGNVCSNIPVTASAPGFNGLISGSMIVNVTQPNYGSADIVSISVIPATQTVASLNVPIQYEAVGTTAGGATVALSGYPLQLKWASSDAAVATINASTGLATTVGSGTSTITATFTNADGTGAVGSAALTVAPSGSPEPLTSLTISPNTQTASAVGQTADFLAIATTGSGSSVNLTNQSAVVNGKTIAPAVWTSSAPGVASINSATGVATAVSAGAAIITAIATNTNDGTVVTGTATFTVAGTTTTSAEPLASLIIVPATQTALAVNQKVNFIAIGTTGTGSTVNLTGQAVTINGKTIGPAVWSSSNPSVATIDPTTGIATSLSAGATAIVAIVTNPSDGTVVTGTAVFTVTVPSTTEPFVSLAIVPASQTLSAVGQLANYLAIGTTGTGATVDLTSKATWGSSNPAVAKATAIAGQFAAGTTNGVTAITATVPNASVGGSSTDTTSVTGSAVLTVSIAATAEPLLSLSIQPSAQSVAGAPQTTQFLAIGDFSASSTTPGMQNMANPTVAALYTVAWYSSNPQVATVCSVGGLCPTTPGLVTAVGPGVTAITAIATNNADKSGATAVATFTVSGPQVLSVSALSIFPGSPAVTLPVIGSTTPATVQFYAIGTNGSTGLQTLLTSPQVQWSATNPLVATIGSNGIATAVGPGSTTITAMVTPTGGGVVTATATLTVAGSAAEPLLSLAIVPVTASVAYPAQAGQTPQTVQFTAIGTFTQTPTQPVTENLTSNNTTFPIRWTSSNKLVATVGSPEQAGTVPGQVTAVGQGTAVIMAAVTIPADGSVVTGTATFTVVNAPAEPVSSLQIVPSTQSVSKGQNGQFIVLGLNAATGLQSDLTTAASLSWSSSIPTVATVCNAGPAQPLLCPTTPGQVTGVTAGSTTITAEYQNADKSVVTASAILVVTTTVAISNDITSVTIEPASQTDLYIDQTTQFIAIGTSAAAPYTFDVTNCDGSAGAPCFGGSNVWASSNVDVATINTTGTTGPTNGGLGAPAGLATLLWEGTTAITSTFTNTDNSIATGVATLTCPFGQCTLEPPPVPPLVTLTVFGAGDDTINWLVTAPSASGAANEIHCGPSDTTPGGQVCVGSYPIGTQITLSTTVPAPPPPGSPACPTCTFGGWASGPEFIYVEVGTPPVLTQEASPSYCTPTPLVPTQTGLNQCTITVSLDSTVVAIFNK